MKNCIVTVAVSLLALASCAQGKAAADSSQTLADRIVESRIPVLVDFWAVWCPPCKYLDPIIEELEKEYRGKVLFMKVDVDVHKGLTQYFKVSAVPSVFIIEDKTVRSAFPGVRDKKTYQKALNDAIKLAAERSPPPADKAKPPSDNHCTTC